MEEENKINLLMAFEESYEILLQGIAECDLSRGMRYLDIGASCHMTREVDPIFDLKKPSLKANIQSHGRLDKEGYDIHLYIKKFLTIHDKRGILLTKVK